MTKSGRSGVVISISRERSSYHLNRKQPKSRTGPRQTSNLKVPSVPRTPGNGFPILDSLALTVDLVTLGPASPPATAPESPAPTAALEATGVLVATSGSCGTSGERVELPLGFFSLMDVALSHLRFFALEAGGA